MVVSQSGSSGNPYRFAGAWRYRDDGDAGLLHVGARYYDPQVGRFIRRDPVLSEHPYLYCQHEPVNKVDPSGELPALAIAAVVVIVIISLPGCKPGDAKPTPPSHRQPVSPHLGQGHAGDYDGDGYADGVDRDPRNPAVR